MEKTKTTESTYTVRIGRIDLIKFVKDHYATDLPASVEIFVRVPGGGDWSGMDLEIDGDEEVVVRWKEISSDE